MCKLSRALYLASNMFVFGWVGFSLSSLVFSELD